MKIGFFDSGIGGLSVLHYACKVFPNNHFLYYADKDNVPYGEKSPNQILCYTMEAVDFLINQGAEIIVIACNTATSVAIKQLREKYKVPILGMEPAVKKAVEHYTKKRILVAATPITVVGEKMHDLINRVDNHHQVDCIALAKLVYYAEKGMFESSEVNEYLHEQFQQFDFKEYSAFILGCTHFNYFKRNIRRFLPKHVKFVDGNQGVVNHLMNEANRHNLMCSKQTKLDFYYSSHLVTDKSELNKINQYFSLLDEMLLIE